LTGVISGFHAQMYDLQLIGGIFNGVADCRQAGDKIGQYASLPEISHG
jgi:hypothetical protein